ncbi:MAG TPA: SURF1 family protein, partial [Chloroflexota bacterium]|nr:SURF1 family protein [Chloroflexota bacterium]
MLFSRRWRWMTLAAVLACGVTLALGYWQLERLDSRRALNERLASRLHASPVAAAEVVAAGADLDELEFRPVVLRGTFDYAAEVAVANQVHGGKLGFHLLTPLVLEGNQGAVLVDRGWIPIESVQPSAWAQYRAGDPNQVVEIRGWLRRPAPPTGNPARTADPSRIVATASVEDIQARTGRSLLPVVVAQAPSASERSEAGATRLTDGDSLPYRAVPVASLGDGVHFIAAVQWFLIGGIIIVGLVAYVRRQMQPAQSVPRV